MAEKYARLIGVNFGNKIYDGAYWNTDTNLKQYCFLNYDKDMRVLESQEMMTWKEFKAFIEQFDISQYK
ncbi:MAG: hypothetical protein WCL51_18270 [Bacteroidota bacterium]